MKLRQLECVLEVFEHDLNISSAAKSLGTTQPALSKQIQALEIDLGVKLFSRQGKRLTSISPYGMAIVERARTILSQVSAIRSIARDAQSESSGSMRIATTHTQARYVLPRPIRQFRWKYPDVSLHVNQGTPEQLAEMTMSGDVDFAIATEGLEFFEDLVMLPCYRWNRSIVVPTGHRFTKLSRGLTMEDLADEALVTYVFGFARGSRITEAFRNSNIEPNVVFTATDTDVIKTYVREGLGVGIIASMAFDPRKDSDLEAIDASHLFLPSTTHIGFRKGAFLRRFMFDFIELFSPNLNRDFISEVLYSPTSQKRDLALEDQKIPLL